MKRYKKGFNILHVVGLVENNFGMHFLITLRNFES